MAVNRAKPRSNMYPGWDTWNPIYGCDHDCTYCYIKSVKFGNTPYPITPGFRENYLKDNLGTG